MIDNIFVISYNVIGINTIFYRRFNHEIIARCMIALLSFLYLVTPVRAIETQSTPMTELDRIARIEALYDERNILELNPVENAPLINAIDNELVSLGVEEVSYSEVYAKVNDGISPRITTPSHTGVIWTKVTTTISYYGKMYEIEAFTGTLDTDNYINSPLRSTSAAISASAYNFQPDNIIACFLDIGISEVGDIISNTYPVISEILSYGQTLYNMYNAIDSSYSNPSTIVNNVDCTFTVLMNTTMRYVFIKSQGASQYSQILGYAGNKTACSITCVKPSGRFYTNADGDLVEDPDIVTISGSVQSKGFGNSHMMAGMNLYNYRELGYYEHQLSIYNYIGGATMNCLFDLSTNSLGNQARIIFPLCKVW